MDYFVNILGIIFDFFILIKFEELFLFSKRTSKQKFESIFFTCICLSSMGFANFKDPLLKLALYTIIYILFSIFYFKVKLPYIFLLICLEYFTMAILMKIISEFFYFLMGVNSATSTFNDEILCFYFSYAALFILISIVEYFFNNRRKGIINPYEMILFQFLFFTIFVISLSLFLYQEKKFYAILLIILIYFFIFIFLLYYFFKKITQQKQTEYDLKLALDLSKLTHDYEERLEQNTAMLRSLRHDLKNHLIAIEGYINAENTDKALDYIHTISSETIFPDTLVNTKSVPLSALLSRKKQLCQEKEILFTPEIITTSSLVTDIDLCIIVGNLLDNAIEAAEKVEDQNGYIDFSLQARNNIIHILCCNNYLTQPITSRGKLITHKVKQKSLHGIGLENMQKLVDKYDGTMNYSFDDHIFTMEILIKVSIPVIE